jgi:phage gpG-like protein
MSFRITKKLAALEEMQARLKTVQQPLREAIKEIAVEIKFHVNRQFATSRDPYDVPWAALSPRTIKRRRFPGRPILIQTRKLSREIGKKTSGFKTTVTAKAPYAHWHQSGTEYMPQRMIFPSVDRMPASWRQGFIRIARGKLRRHFGGV